jgi:hypothetical protein
MENKPLSKEDEELANSIVENINEILDTTKSSSQYITLTESKKAILLFGSWGVGKTKLIEYALNNRIENSIANSVFKNKKLHKEVTKKYFSYLLTADANYIEKLHAKDILYISVFGLKNKQEIFQAIVKQYLDKTGETEEKKKLSQTILNISSSIFKLNKELFDSGNQLDLVTLEKTVNKIINNKVIIIDDLERIASFESFIELISFINNTQQKIIKNKPMRSCFILIANKKELYENYNFSRNKTSYLQMNTGLDFVFEKILFSQFEISESLSKTLNFFNSLDSIKNWNNANFGFYNKLIVTFGIYNLRFINDTIETFNNLIKENEYTEDYMKRSIYLLILLFKYFTVFSKDSYKYKESIGNDIFTKDATVEGLLFLVQNFCKTNEDFLKSFNSYYENLEQYKSLEIKDQEFSSLMRNRLRNPQERYQNIIKNRRKELYIEEYKNYIINYKEPPEKGYYGRKREEKLKLKAPISSDLVDKVKKSLIKSYEIFINKPLSEIHSYKHKKNFLEKYLPEIKTENSLNYNEFSVVKYLFNNDNHPYEVWMKFYNEIDNLSLNNEEKIFITNLDNNNNNELANYYLIFFLDNFKKLGIRLDKFSPEYIQKLINAIMHYNGKERIDLNWSENSKYEIQQELFQQDFYSFELAIKQINPLTKEPYKYTKNDIINYFTFISSNIDKLSVSNVNTLFYLNGALQERKIQEITNLIEEIKKNIKIILDNKDAYNHYYDLYNGEMSFDFKKLIHDTDENIRMPGINHSEAKHKIEILEINDVYKKREYSQNFFNLVAELFKKTMYTAGHIPTDDILELDQLDNKVIEEVSKMSDREIIKKYYENNDLFLLHNMRIIYLNSKHAFEIKNEKIRVFFKKIKSSFLKYLSELDDEHIYIWLFFKYYEQYYYTALEKVEDVSK